MKRKPALGILVIQVYDRKHPHSELGYLTSIEFQRKTWLNFTNYGLKNRWHFNIILGTSFI